MPNQRSKKKSFVGGYVPSKLAADIRSVAKHEHKDVVEIIVELFNEGVKKRNRARLKRASKAAVNGQVRDQEVQSQ